MAISTTIIKNSYSGDGSNDTFAYQFKIAADADIQVIIRSAAGTETVKSLTTHYHFYLGLKHNKKPPLEMMKL